MKSKKIYQLTIPGTPGKSPAVLAFDTFQNVISYVNEHSISTFVIQLISFYSSDPSNANEKTSD